MVEDLSKKVVLITGCSSGIGLMTAVEMARSGFRVFASMRNLNKREDLDSAAKEAKVLLDVIELDVTKKDSIHSAIKVIENKAGSIDILVNNAGYSFLGFAEDVELNDLKQIFNTNFFGLVEMTQAIVPKMRERHTGHIINISSTLGIIGVAAFSAYCASKFAIEGYMESLRYEGLLDGYYVSNIEPGVFRTSIFSNAKKFVKPDSPYSQKATRIIKYMEQETSDSSPPQSVAKLVVKIAKAKKPRLRYPIGKEKIYLFIRKFLPETILEKLIMKQIRDIIS